MDSAANRTQFHPESGADLLVGEPFDVTQHHGRTEFRRQFVQCGLQVRVQVGVRVDLLRAGGSAGQAVGVLRQALHPQA